jgi:hypothetical protein
MSRAKPPSHCKLELRSGNIVRIEFKSHTIEDAEILFQELSAKLRTGQLQMSIEVEEGATIYEESNAVFDERRRR